MEIAIKIAVLLIFKENLLKYSWVRKTKNYIRNVVDLEISIRHDAQ